jgi:hypothetical protein
LNITINGTAINNGQNYKKGNGMNLTITMGDVLNVIDVESLKSSIITDVNTDGNINFLYSIRNKVSKNYTFSNIDINLIALLKAQLEITKDKYSEKRSSLTAKIGHYAVIIQNGLCKQVEKMNRKEFCFCYDLLAIYGILHKEMIGFVGNDLAREKSDQIRNKIISYLRQQRKRYNSKLSNPRGNRIT